MKLSHFLKQVDADAGNMSKPELESFVHELARTLPESRREYFLETMHSLMESQSAGVSEGGRFDALELEVREGMDVLTGIMKGIRVLASRHVSKWNGGYYIADSKQIIFSDPDRLLLDIEKCIRLLEKCIDWKGYRQGGELAALISELEVTVRGDYGLSDNSSLNVENLYHNRLLTGTFENIVRESLFLAYMGNVLEDRPFAMFRIIKNYQCYTVRLEEVMQVGNHSLTDFEGFLPLWIDYLGNMAEEQVAGLLAEAQGLLEDGQARLDVANKYGAQYPGLYKQLLQSELENADSSRYFCIGNEILGKLSDACALRADIALLTAEYACRMGDRPSVEKCWMEAFRSAPSAVNYLRLRLKAENWEKYKEQVKQIYQVKLERTEETTYFIILFFEEEFDNVIKNGMSEEMALNLSSAFVEEGMALFLLLLYQGDVLPEELMLMLEKVVTACKFHSDTFFSGTGSHENKNDEVLFWELFREWKSKLQLDKSRRNQWLEKIKHLIKLRTAGIVKANHTSYYFDECLTYLTAAELVEKSQI